MTWVLLISAIVNGQVMHADKATFKTKADCLQALTYVQQQAIFKAYNAKAVCEKASVAQ